VRDCVRRLARRAPLAFAAWFPLALALAYLSGHGAVAGPFSDFVVFAAFASLAAGVPAGLVLSRDLVERAGFAGAVPWLLAVASGVLVVAAGTALANALLSYGTTFHAFLVGTMASLGAAAAATKRTWAEH
jgi:hypothetical protein